MKPTQILNKMLDLTHKLDKLNEKLENQEMSGAEWLTVNAINKAIGLARAAFEMRLNNKESKNG